MILPCFPQLPSPPVEELGLFSSTVRSIKLWQVGSDNRQPKLDCWCYDLRYCWSSCVWQWEDYAVVGGVAMLLLLSCILICLRKKLGGYCCIQNRVVYLGKPKSSVGHAHQSIRSAPMMSLPPPPPPPPVSSLQRKLHSATTPRIHEYEEHVV